jgi:hypothetical protein
MAKPFDEMMRGWLDWCIDHTSAGRDEQGLEALEREHEPQQIALVTRADRPTIVCLCGSTKFRDEFEQANYELTMAGAIVLSVGFYWNSPRHGEGVGLPDDPAERAETKRRLDELHLRKIDLADLVVVVNPGGYVGESTAREVAYARSHGKRVLGMFEPVREVL